jgi:hypothetical protein
MMSVRLCPGGGVWLGHGAIMEDFPLQFHHWLRIPHPVMCTETHVGLYEKFPLLLSDFNRKWNVLRNFSRTPQYQVSQQDTGHQLVKLEGEAEGSRVSFMYTLLD